MSAERVERRLAAILAADVSAGYSAADGAGREPALWRASTRCARELIDPKVAEHKGRVVKTTGDGLLIDFASAVDAVRCAVAVQEALARESAQRQASRNERRIEFRIGIHVGDVIVVDGANLLGDGVNIAARLESLAEPGAICVSAAARDQIGNKLPIPFDDLGDQSVKNIAQPIRVYRVGPRPSRPPAGAGKSPAHAP